MSDKEPSLKNELSEILQDDAANNSDVENAEYQEASRNLAEETADFTSLHFELAQLSDDEEEEETLASTVEPHGKLPVSNVLQEQLEHLAERESIQQSSDMQLVLELLYVINNKMDVIRNEVKQSIQSLDVKKMKRSRTMTNRCTYIREKTGERCRGYFCQNSQALCYAHHSIAKKSLKNSHFLYGSKDRHS